MGRSEKAMLTFAIIGLVADIITMAGLSSGFVIPNPDLSPLLSEKAYTIISLSLMFYFEVLILLFAHRILEKKIKMKDIPEAKRSSRVEGISLLSISYGIWIPTFLIWMSATCNSFTGGQLFVVGLFGSAIGGFFILMVSASLNEILNPYE